MRGLKRRLAMSTRRLEAIAAHRRRSPATFKITRRPPVGATGPPGAARATARAADRHALRYNLIISTYTIDLNTVTACYCDALSGHVGGAIGGQEHGRLAHLFGLTPTLQGE